MTRTKTTTIAGNPSIIPKKNKMGNKVRADGMLSTKAGTAIPRALHPSARSRSSNNAEFAIFTALSPLGNLASNRYQAFNIIELYNSLVK